MGFFVSVFDGSMVETHVLWPMALDCTGVPCAGAVCEEYLTGQTRADQVYSDRGWYGDAWTTVGHSAVENLSDCSVVSMKR